MTEDVGKASPTRAHIKIYHVPGIVFEFIEKENAGTGIRFTTHCHYFISSNKKLLAFGTFFAIWHKRAPEEEETTPHTSRGQKGKTIGAL